MQLTFLNILQSEIPCEKIFLIDGIEYSFIFMYNDVFDFYTIVIKDMNGDVIISNKLSYQQNAFSPVIEKLPDVRLVPIALSEFEQETSVYNRIGIDNFDNVRICIV